MIIISRGFFAAYIHELDIVIWKIQLYISYFIEKVREDIRKKKKTHDCTLIPFTEKLAKTQQTQHEKNNQARNKEQNKDLLHGSRNV